MIYQGFFVVFFPNFFKLCFSTNDVGIKGVDFVIGIIERLVRPQCIANVVGRFIKPLTSGHIILVVKGVFMTLIVCIYGH